MSCIVLNVHTVLSASASGPGERFDVDWRMKSAEIVRSFGITKHTDDVIYIEGAFTTAGPWFILASVGTGIVSAAANVAGSWPHFRAHKVAENGVAVVIGAV